MTDDQTHECEFLCTSQAEMREKHGTPDRFAISVSAAVPSFISADEAFAAIGRYKLEYERMPETPQVTDKELMIAVAGEVLAALRGPARGDPTILLHDLFDEKFSDEEIAVEWARMMERRPERFLVRTIHVERASELLSRIETDRHVKFGGSAGMPLEDYPWFKGRVWQLAWKQGIGGGGVPSDIYMDGWDAHWPPRNIELVYVSEDDQ